MLVTTKTWTVSSVGHYKDMNCQLCWSLQRHELSAMLVTTQTNISCAGHYTDIKHQLCWSIILRHQLLALLANKYSNISSAGQYRYQLWWSIQRHQTSAPLLNKDINYQLTCSTHRHQSAMLANTDIKHQLCWSTYRHQTPAALDNTQTSNSSVCQYWHQIWSYQSFTRLECNKILSWM